jgi:hypothetical protein
MKRLALRIKSILSHRSRLLWMADQHVQQNTVVSFLNAMAALKKMDVAHDFYRHPSVKKRIANLGLSQETRFIRWHFEL